MAADDTTFVIPEVDLGIALTWGAIPRMVREMPAAIVRELVLTCRPFGAHEAKSIGFVNHVVACADTDAHVDQLASELARKAPSVVGATKRQVNEALDHMASTAGTWAEADLLEAALRDPALRDPAVRAAAERYLANRAAARTAE